MTRAWAGALLMAAALPGAAAAQDWTAQTGAQARLLQDSNPGLVRTPAGGLTTQQLSARSELTRRSEAGESGIEAELILSSGRGGGRGAGTAGTAGSDGRDTTALGRAALRQRLSLERHTWRGELSYRRDRPLEGRATAGAVALGRTEQAVGEAELTWSYLLNERLTAELSGTYTDTDTDTRPGSGPSAAAQNYAVGSGTAALQYAWSETSSLSTSLQRTQQRLGRGDTRISIDSLRLGWTGALSDTASLNLSVAQSRTSQEFTLRGFACPLPVQFCTGGIVPFVPTESSFTRSREQWQYSAGGSLRYSPVTNFSANATRALTPGPLGVNREDRWSLSCNRSWSERLRASLSLDESRTAPPAGTTAPARLRSLSLDASYSVQERWTLVLQAQARRYSSTAPGSGAGSRVFSISLQYLDATVPGWL